MKHTRNFRCGDLVSAFLVIAGVAAIAASCVQMDLEADSCFDTGELERRNPLSGREFTRPADVHARTDMGRPVPLSELVNGEHPQAVGSDDHLFHAAYRRLTIIRTGEAGAASNCHGWVYSGGKYRIACRDVDLIVQDNYPEAVTQPEPNDLVIYRQGREVLHSGVVRAVWDEKVLVESKWGAMGVFFHLVQHSPYGREWTYYRTARGHHLLKGIPFSPDEPIPDASGFEIGQ